MTSSFELGTNRHILALADPHECIPTASFNKRFKLHVDSEELGKVGVNSLEYTPDSLKLGGQQCLVNGVVYPNFSQVHTKPSSVRVGATSTTNSSRKRPSSTENSTEIPINPKVCASQGTRRVNTSPVEPQSSVPEASTHQREAQQANIHHVQVEVHSQPEPEETSVEPPPNRSSNLNSAILERIKSYGSISISRADSPHPVTADVVSPPPQGAKVDNIIEKYKHIWSQE